MRHVALPAAALLLVTAATGVWAGSGLPRLAALDIGPYYATLHNDSPALRKGANTLTVEIPSLPAGQQVELWLRGPAGQLLAVPLLPVRVLGGAATGGEHGEAGRADTGIGRTGSADHGATAAPHVAPGLVPLAAAADHTADHVADRADDNVRGGPGHGDAHTPGGAATTFLGRGAITLPGTGVWHAIVRVGAHDEIPLEAEAAIETVDGSPNPLYLGATGSLIGGSLVYGAVERRRRPARSAASVQSPKNGR